MARSAVWLLAAAMLLGAVPAGAGDTAPVAKTGPLLPEPQVEFGCQRIWRCDTTVCEWRRGCRGVYGYFEAPYFTSAFALRQWQMHGLPGRPPVKRLKKPRKVSKSSKETKAGITSR